MGGIGVHDTSLAGARAFGYGKSCRSCIHCTGNACDQPTRLRYGKPFDPERPCGYHRTRQRLFEQGRRPEGPEAECMGASGLRSRPVLRDDMKWFPSCNKGARASGAPDGFGGSGVARCCAGKQRTAYGHAWMYADECVDGVFRIKYDELKGGGDEQ